MNYGFGDTHMAGKILKYVNECFNTWECKSWSEIIYVTTTGFCIIVCCMSFPTVVVFVVYVVCIARRAFVVIPLLYVFLNVRLVRETIKAFEFEFGIHLV